jgi:hypothetical protein
MLKALDAFTMSFSMPPIRLHGFEASETSKSVEKKTQVLEHLQETLYILSKW